MSFDAVSWNRDAAARTSNAVWEHVAAQPLRVGIVAKRGHLARRADGSVLWPESALPDADRSYLGVLERPDGPASVELRIIEDGEFDWCGLRELIGELDEVETELALTAIALTNWRSSHRYCPGCGSALAAAHAGWMLECGACGTQVWPRTDPAIIVRVEDDHGRVLLGSNAMWEQNRYSLLAGFVEPGESLEAAVVREIAEESGVAVHSPSYLASQSWPYPASLMLGFRASAVPGELVPDGEEILDLRWFDRDDICSPDIVLPRRGSLARALLEDWFGGPIPERHG